MSNQFEELTERAARERWCWSLTCKQCGHARFREVLYSMASGTGRAPAEDLAGATIPPSPWPLPYQHRLVEVGVEANLDRIIDASPHPDWLGYLGLLLYYTADAEQHEPRLTRAFLPQLEARMKPGAWDEFMRASRVGACQLLTWQDMTHLMNARMRRPARRGGEFPRNTHRESYDPESGGWGGGGGGGGGGGFLILWPTHAELRRGDATTIVPARAWLSLKSVREEETRREDNDGWQVSADGAQRCASELHGTPALEFMQTPADRDNSRLSDASDVTEVRSRDAEEAKAALIAFLNGGSFDWRFTWVF